MFHTNPYTLSVVVIGLASLGMAWMPSLAKAIKVSYSVIYLLLGMLVYTIFPELPFPDPIQENDFTLHFTEIAVIVSLMGTGLKIDHRFSFRNWRAPFRLVSLTMILCIAALSAAAYFFLHFDLASSILLGAILAPTDPVLASDVQVGPPLEEPADAVRFSLTAEAGMNDGTAFPFTWLAILIAASGSISLPELGVWFARDVVYRMIAGVICGFVLGRLLALLIFDLPEKNKVVSVRDGFVGVAVTLLVYGVTEMVSGYGFVAVFVTAVTLRNYEMNHKLHRRLHDFTDQVERIMVAVVLLIFGGSLVNGILDYLTWESALVGIILVFIVRPLAGLISLPRTGLTLREKLVISFFGIRGVGSIFYLAFALSEAYFGSQNELWSLLSFIIVLSVVVHGLTATPIMNKLDGEQGKK